MLPAGVVRCFGIKDYDGRTYGWVSAFQSRCIGALCVSSSRILLNIIIKIRRILMSKGLSAIQVRVNYIEYLRFALQYLKLVVVIL